LLVRSKALLRLLKKETSMPQLDVTTFFSQFFWLSVFFLGFYVILVRSYLPRISRLLKLRTRKVSSSQTSLPTSENHSDKQISSSNPDHIVVSAIRVSSDEIQACTQSTASWMQDCLSAAQSTQFQEINTAYFSTLSQLSAEQNLNAQIFKTLCSPRDFQNLGLPAAGTAREKAFSARLLRTI